MSLWQESLGLNSLKGNQIEEWGNLITLLLKIIEMEKGKQHMLLLSLHQVPLIDTHLFLLTLTNFHPCQRMMLLPQVLLQEVMMDSQWVMNTPNLKTGILKWLISLEWNHICKKLLHGCITLKPNANQ
jgi:hypothetical protein